MGTENISPLQRIISRTIDLNADEIEIEYKSGYEEVCVMNGNFGVGIESINAKTEEAKQLRQELYSIAKKKIKIRDLDIEVQVHIFDSFGEDAFRIKLKSV